MKHKKESSEEKDHINVLKKSLIWTIVALLIVWVSVSVLYQFTEAWMHECAFCFGFVALITYPIMFGLSWVFIVYFFKAIGLIYKVYIKK